MAEAKRVERPLSPHLQIYRWQIPMLTSILTRITGHALYAGFFLAVWWLLAAATSTEYFDFVNGLATSWIGILIWVGCAWAMWFHYLTGLRHLYYDAGKGLDVPTAEKLGWACLIGSVVLTAVLVLLVMM